MNAAIHVFQSQLGSYAGPEGALVFALDMAVQARCLDKLAQLLNDQRPFDAYSGDPGWTVERRRPGQTHTGFDPIEPWPDGAEFRASVDADAYPLAQPSHFLDRATFTAWLARAQGLSVAS